VVYASAVIIIMKVGDADEATLDSGKIYRTELSGGEERSSVMR
jgi:hypothetical protein